MNRSLGSAFFSLVSGKVVTTVVTIVSLPVIVRVLGADGYGDYAFLISTFSLLMIFVSSGVTEGVQKYVAEERDHDRWKEQVVGFYLRTAVVLAAFGVAGMALLAYSGVVADLFGPRFEGYFYLLAVFVLTAQIRSFSRRTLMGLGLEWYSEPLRVAGKLIWVGLGLGLAWTGLGVAAFVISNVVSAAVVGTVGLAIIARQLSVRKILKSTAGSFPRGELLSFNFLNIVLVLLLMSLFHVDVVMVRSMTGSQETGLYKAALAIAEYVWFVPLTLQTLMLHSSSTLWADGAAERIQDLASMLTRYVALLTGLFAIGLVVLADRFIPLYFGSEFTGAVVPLIVLLPGAVGFAMAKPIYAINQGSGRLRSLILATGVAAFLNAGLNYALIPLYGPTGAAAATSVGYGSMFLLHVGCARWLGYDPIDDLRPVRVATTAGVACLAIFVVARAIPGDLLALVLVPPLGAAVYVGVAVTVGAIDIAEAAEAAGSLPAPIGPRLRSVISGAE